MSFVFGLIWLAGAVGLFAYEYATGQPVLRVPGLNISQGWFMLVMAGWSFARWYSARSFRQQQETLRIVHEARLRQARHRERPVEIDPTFDFSDTPPSPRPPGDAPPSAN